MTRGIEIGTFHRLRVAETVEGGVLLDGAGTDLFLPAHQAQADAAVDDWVNVFVYGDHDGAPQATTKMPAASLGEVALLRCVSVTPAGAYLAWGIPKDLYVPPNEQEVPMVQGGTYVAAVCLDRKGERLIASSHLSAHFDYDVKVQPDDEVALLVYGHCDAGIQVVVAHRYRGMIHRSDVYRELAVGDELTGYVQNVRDDNRLDIRLTRPGTEGMQDAQVVILAALRKAGGSLALHDRSSPKEIEGALGMSKKAFKRGIGGLYKARKIVLSDGAIALSPDDV